jgi:hypothetical protein
VELMVKDNEGQWSAEPDTCTEFEDGDGDPDTKSYASSIAESGEITVTATPSPSMSEAELPDSWTLTGGAGTRLTRTIDRTIAGITTITCTAGSSSKENTIYVVEAHSLEPHVGTEIDDGDGNPDTRSYVVGVTDTGVVTITATPNPSLSAQNLPSDWSLTSTGGTKIDNLTYTVDRTTPGVTTITATCGSSSQATTIYVVEVDNIEINYAESEWDDVTGETIVVLKGTKYTFKAVPNPTNVGWPTNSPIWSGVASGTGETIEATFDSSGTKTLTAKCGSGDTGKTVTIKVIVPEPDQIYFLDYTIGEEHDIYGVTDPVWKRVSNPDDPASYTKNKHVRVRAKFWSSENLTYGTQVHVDVGGVDWSTFTEDTTVSFHTWPSESTFHNSDGPLLDTIGSTTPNFAWSYKVPSGTKQWINMASQSGPHKIYRVLDTPVAPQAQPWKEVLEKACDWASGESAVLSAVGEIVDNIFASGYEYENVGGAPRYYDSTDGKFKLTTCLSEWGDPSKDINCWDTGNMVAIFSNSLGCDLHTYYMARPGLPPPAFLLNYIKPIGRSWTNDPFTPPGRQGFACHWTAWAKVHDACLQVDDDSDPTSSPHTGKQPLDVTFDAGTPSVPYDDYRGKLVDPVHELLVSGSPQPPAEVK